MIGLLVLLTGSLYRRAEPEGTTCYYGDLQTELSRIFRISFPFYRETFKFNSLTSARSVSRGCAGDLRAVVLLLPVSAPHPQLEAGRAQVGGAAALAPAEHAETLDVAPS